MMTEGASRTAGPLYGGCPVQASIKAPQESAAGHALVQDGSDSRPGLDLVRIQIGVVDRAHLAEDRQAVASRGPFASILAHARVTADGSAARDVGVGVRDVARSVA